MRIPRLHVRQPLAAGDTLTLETEASHYLANVLRLQPGRPLRLFNGDGGEYDATLVHIRKKAVTVAIGAQHPDAGISPLMVEVAVAVSRGERFDWIVQKATELGACRIQPLWSERVEVKLSGNRLDRKLEHWRRITISASEQCGRTRLPELAEPRTLADHLTQPPHRPGPDTLRLILHPPLAQALTSQADGEAITAEPKAGHSTDALTSASPPISATLLAGPEGGWTESEVQAALDAGFRTWQLGSRILRAETAPVAALAVLQHRFGDG